MKSVLALTLMAFAVLILSPHVAAQTLTINNDIQTYSTLTNTAVTVSGTAQLRITGATSPISGSTINLTSPDAWFFMTSIAPSVVNSSYLGQVKISGSAAVLNTNCRIVRYGDGAVVIPQGTSYRPLTVYSGPMFSGSSIALLSNSAYTVETNLPAVFANNIVSFKLKRGYEVTFAQNSDGTGISKNYVAADGDIEVGVMPTDLGNGTSFIRVFPWRWTNKKGIAGNITSGLNLRWWYDWNIDKNSSLDTEYVAIRQSHNWPSLSQDWKARGINHLLGYNEPDHTDQANMSVSTALSSWHDLLGTGLRVGAPAVSDGGKSWLYSFMNQANSTGLRVDFIPIHYYQCHNPADPAGAASQMYNFLADVWNRYHKPIWITEWNNGANWTNCGDPTATQQQACISAMMDMLESTPWVERYALYNWVEDVRRVKWDSGSLTAAGTTYRDKVSNLAYRQVVPSVPTPIRAHYRFEGDARDNAGRSNNAILHGTAKFAAGKMGQAVILSGSAANQDYVELPPRVTQTSDFTFGAWVYWNGGSSWQRIFDLGEDTDAYMYLTPSSSAGKVSFGIYNGSTKQTIDASSALPVNTWTHVAVTIAGSTGKLFVNGSLVGTNTSMTINPSDLGATTCYLGKSQWSSDPLFAGMLDEVYFLPYAEGDALIPKMMTNTPPQFSSHVITTGSGSQGHAFNGTIAGSAADADSGDSVTYYKGTGASWLSVATNGTISGTPPSGTDGPQSFVVYAVDSVGASDYAVLTVPLPYLNGNGTWTADSSGAWSDTTNWSNGFAANASGYTADFSTIDISADTTVTLDSSRTIGGLIFGDTSGTQSWTLTSSSNSKLTLQVSAGSPSITINQNTATISLALSGTAGLTKSGTGTLVLAGANSLSGTITLNAGTVAVGDDSAFGTSTVNLNGAAIRSADASDHTIDNAITLSTNTTFGSADTGNLLFTGDMNAGSLSKTLTINNAQTEFSGVISGAGARIKDGPGALVLSGSNTYTGPTTLSAGTLAVNGSIVSGTLTCASGTILTGSGSIASTTTIYGTHSPGAGPGTQTFTGALTYGATAHLSWELGGNTVASNSFDSVTASAVIVNSGATVDLVFNGSGSTVDFTNSFWIYPHKWTAIVSSGTSSDSFTLGNVTTDSNGRNPSDYGTFALQQSRTAVVVSFIPIGGVPLPQQPGGVTTISGNNQVSLNWADVTGADSYTILRSTTSGGPYTAIATGMTTTSFRDITAVNGTLYFYVISAVNTAGAGPNSVEIAVVPHVPTTINKADNTNNLNVASSWSNNVLPDSGDIVKWSGLAGANSVVLGADLNVKGIITGTTGGAVSISGSNTLAVGVSGIDMSAASQDLEISSNLTLGGGNQVWTIPTGRTLTLDTGTFMRAAGASLNVQTSGTIAANMDALANDGSSGGGLIKWATIGTGTNTRFAALSGSGVLIPFTSGSSVANFGWTPNTGNGDDNVNYDVAATTGNIGIARTANVVRYTGGAATQNYGSNNTSLLPLNALMNAGTGTLTIAKSAGLSGFVAGTGEGEGELLLIAANAGITISAPIYDSETTTSGATTDVTLGGVPSAVTIVGPNTVTLSGTNLFTGGVVLNSGTLSLGNNYALGTGNLILAGGALTSSAAVAVSNAVFVSANTVTNIRGVASDITLNGNISGSGSLDMAGALSASAINLGGNNSGFMGTATISGVNIRLTSPNGGSSSAAWVINGGAGLQATTNAGAYSLGSLSGSGNLGTRNVTGTAIYSVGGANTSTTFTGTITNVGTVGNAGGSGIVALTKVGIGTLTLAGSNTYTGATTVSNGTLAVNGVLSGTGAVSVANSAILSGTGTVAGRITLASGGTISPGNAGIGVLTGSGGLTLNDGSILNFGIGVPASQLSLGGPVTASGTTSINITALNGFSTGTYPLISGTGSISADNFALGTTPSGYTYSLSASNGTLSVTVVSPSQLWRQTNFGADWNNDAIAGDNADPDGDGVSNLLERAFGMDPNARDQNLLPAIDDNGPFFSITYRKAKAATDLTFTVQESSDLKTWTTSAGTSTVLNPDDSASPVQLIRFTAPAGSARKKFLRVQLAKP
jgi:autotransporter-associated beta strand protein